MQLILEGNAKNLLNGYLKRAAVASCAGANGVPVFVIYLAENSLGNAFAAETIAALKAQKTPINAEAEAAIVTLKEDLLGLVRLERSARMIGDLAKLDALGRAIKVTVANIKLEEAKLVQARVDAEEDKRALQLVAEQVRVMNGKIKIAEGELSVAIAKHQRLTKAKDILMARGGEPMTPDEEKDFASSITSFIELVDKCNKEVAVKQGILNGLVNDRNMVANPVVTLAPVMTVAPAAPRPVAPAAPAAGDLNFDKLLPDTLNELPNDSAASTKASAFDSLVPVGLA